MEVGQGTSSIFYRRENNNDSSIRKNEDKMVTKLQQKYEP